MALNRQLRFVSTLAVSVAMMAPSLAISLNPQVMSEDVGAAIPMAFLVAAVVVPMLAWCFVVLSRRNVGTSGSVLHYVGSALGDRAGRFAGMLAAITYTVAVAVGASGAAVLASVFFARKGQLGSPWILLVISLGTILVAFIVSVGSPPFLTRLMLILETTTVALILVATVSMLVTLLQAGGPEGQRPTTDVFDISVVPLSAVALAVVLAFTSFAGFESAASAGGESVNAGRNIPRAIMMTALTAGVFFFFVSVVVTWAWGTTPNQIASLGSSDSFVGGAADSYIGLWMGDLITLGAVASAMGTAMAGTYAASRMWYSMSVDGVIPSCLARLDSQSVPRLAVIVVVVAAATVVATWSIADDMGNAFAAISTWGGLMFLIVYAFVPVAAAKVLWGPRWRDRLHAIILPVIAFGVVLFTLFKSAVPLPTGPLGPIPYLLLAAVLLATIAAIRRPAHYPTGHSDNIVAAPASTDPDVRSLTDGQSG